MNPTPTCAFRGPHVYTTLPGDNASEDCRRKFKITIAALVNNAGGRAVDPNAKRLPQEYLLSYPCARPTNAYFNRRRYIMALIQTLQRRIMSLGQIVAMNFGYRYSSSDAAGSPGSCHTAELHCIVKWHNNYQLDNSLPWYKLKSSSNSEGWVRLCLHSETRKLMRRNNEILL